MNNQTIDHTITAANGADGSGNCRSKNIAPYDLTALRGRAKAQSGRIGFLTDEQRAQMLHVVRLPDLSRATLGDARFERIYGLCIHSAELIARRADWAETVVEITAAWATRLDFPRSWPPSGSRCAMKLPCKGGHCRWREWWWRNEMARRCP